jgi:hypothetical protein
MESLHKRKLLKSRGYGKGIAVFLVLFCANLLAQFAPPAGEAGTTAMHKDSSAFVGWAISCETKRGLQDVSDPSLLEANVGTVESVEGPATGLTILSLGDGGSAIMQFSNPISNGTGPDFAVFENSFSNGFLELAFVEVSSDGLSYVRFPASSFTQTSIQVGSFGELEATKLNNLAGKYIGNYGTPFDLEDLKNHSSLDVNAVTHVKIIDVVGSIDTLYGSKDTAGNFINDPWPTAFGSSGFDLDAIGVINSVSTSLRGISSGSQSILYPNPASTYFKVKNIKTESLDVNVYDLSGQLVLQSTSPNYISVNELLSGVYLIEMKGIGGVSYQKLKVIHE